MAAHSEQGDWLPTIAIVGRPNVGKSTLFNRLTGKRLALVDDRPGVTRDRREGDASIGALKFRIVDTAGLEDAGPESLARRMTDQSRHAIEQADVCLFMLDGRAGVTPSDQYFAEQGRKTGKPVVIAVNKAEGGKAEAGRLESYSLGLGEPVAISAEHGEGLGDLHDALEEAFRLHLPVAPAEDQDESATSVDEGAGADDDHADPEDKLTPERGKVNADQPTCG